MGAPQGNDNAKGPHKGGGKRKTIYTRHGSSHLGERGRRRIKKRKPITGKELDSLRMRNMAIN
jgi:hypothetical protein